MCVCVCGVRVRVRVHTCIYTPVFHIKKFVYPKNVGLPIGGERNDKYLMIEIHYDNPRMETGIVMVPCTAVSLYIRLCIYCINCFR